MMFSTVRWNPWAAATDGGSITSMAARRRTSALRFEVGALICAGLAACTSAPTERPLRLGTTFTVQQSGALALLDSLTPPDSLATVIAASGQVLQAAARGDLGVAITHAPSLEERLLVIPGHAVRRCPFVTSRFAALGPPSPPPPPPPPAPPAD